MKRVLFVVVIMILTMMLYRADVNAGQFNLGDYLEKSQWGALEDIIADWKAGKLTTDECALYGCYVLTAQEPARTDRIDKAKLIPTKYKLDKKSKQAGPYFFVYFLYKNEGNLSSKALETFKNTDWYEDEFYSDILSHETNNFVSKLFTNDMPKVEEKISFGKNGYDFYDLLLYIVEEKIIKPESAYILIMSKFYHTDKFYKKINIFYKKFNLGSHGDMSSTISKLRHLIKYSKNRTFINLLNYFDNYSNCMTQFGALNIKKYGFNVKSDNNDPKEIETYLQYFERSYDKICVKNGYREPINFVNKQELTIILKNTGDDGDSKPSFDSEYTDLINSFEISLNTKSLDELMKKGMYSPQKTVIHELFHTIQVSYINKQTKPPFCWYESNYGGNNREFVERFKESMAVWAEDYFYDGKDFVDNLYTIYCSIWYFYKEPRNNNYTFPACGFSQGEKYCMGFFWNYFWKIYEKDSMKTLCEMMSTQKITDALIIYAADQKFINILHNFALKNFFLTKKTGTVFEGGIDPQEDKYITAPKDWSPIINIDSLQLKDDKILPHNYTIPGVTQDFNMNIFGWTTQLAKINNTNKFFENSLTINFSWPASINAQDIKISVIPKWYDVNKVETLYGYNEFKVSMGTNTGFYKYYTKKGLNPEYFVIAITNGSINSININVKVDISTSETEVSPQILRQTSKEFEQNVKWLIINDTLITKVKNSESEILGIYSKYKTATGDEQLFLGRQLRQKLNALNLFMLTAINQIHDIRYQYYLIKKACVDSIMKDVNAANLIPQITNFTKFIKEAASFIGDNNNSIEVFNGWAIIYHVDTQLKIIKPINSWTKEELNLMGTANDAMKKISSAVSNSKYPYKYTNEELQESISSPIVGMPADELPGTIIFPPLNGPFQVNLCPNIKNILKASGISYTYKFSTEFRNIVFEADKVPYSATKLLIINDIFDPLSPKYFSSIKVHAYHENNMPPMPTATNMKDYVSAIGYYMKICKDYANCTNKDIVNTRYIMVGGASKQIAEIISLLAEAIIKEIKNGKRDLYTALNKELALVPYKNEVLDLLEKQLKKDGYRE